MWFWRVPAPDEALLISGSKHQWLDTGFRIVTGHGCFVLPIKQKARILSLALREVEIVEDCTTSQGVHLNVRAVAAFKIGDDPASIAAAARRFLPAQNRMEEIAGPMLTGHRMITIARAQTQAAKTDTEPAVPAENPDQGRRARLRQRRAGEVSVLEQPAARRG